VREQRIRSRTWNHQETLLAQPITQHPRTSPFISYTCSAPFASLESFEATRDSVSLIPTRS
jgi:hypothetical protein